MRLGELLLQHRLISQDQLRAALDSQSVYGGRVGTHLVQLGYIDLDLLARALGQQLGVLAALRKHTAAIDKRVIGRFTARAMTSWKAVPIGYTTNRPARAIVACVDPAKAPIEELAFAAGTRVDVWVAPELLVQEALERYYGATPTQARFIEVDFGAREGPSSSMPPMMPRSPGLAIPAPVPSAPRIPSGTFAAVAGPSAYPSRGPDAMPSSIPGRVLAAHLSPPPPAPRSQRSAQLLSPPPPPPDLTSAPAPFSAPRPLAAFTPPPPAFEPLAPPPSPPPPPRRPPPILELELPPFPEQALAPEPLPPSASLPAQTVDGATEADPSSEEDDEDEGTAGALAFIQRKSRAPEEATSIDDTQVSAFAANDMWESVESDAPVEVPPSPPSAPPDALRPFIDQAEASRMLEMATSKELIGRILADWLRSTFGCGIVLIVKNDMAVGWKGYFPDAEDLIEAVAIPLGKPSMFTAAHQTRAAFVGVPGDDGAKVNRLFWRLLRCAPPSEVLVCPIVLGSRTVNLLYAHAADEEPLTDSQMREAEVVANDAGAAYLRLIRRDRGKAG